MGPASDTRSPDDVRNALRGRAEIACIDPRDQSQFAAGHPLFATSLPLDSREDEFRKRLPRLETEIVLYDGGTGLAPVAAQRLKNLGYRKVERLAGDLDHWEKSGGELFAGLNVPSKAFGEFVADQCQTPMIAPSDLRAQLTPGDDVAVIDVRTPREHMLGTIPGAMNIPGGDLASVISALGLRPDVAVVTHCAGRTRGIIAAQSLTNLRILKNHVFNLENGTMGWQLAGFDLAFRGVRPSFRRPPAQEEVCRAAKNLADRAGVTRVSDVEATQLLSDPFRTTYCFDVRSAAEYCEGHLAGFRWAPGGQLLQETDSYMSVRGARVVLSDHDGVRANVTASWLAQMGWETWLLEVDPDADGLVPAMLTRRSESGRPQVESATVERLVDAGLCTVFDVGPRRQFKEGHLPGAVWLDPRRLLEMAGFILQGRIGVITSCDGQLADIVAEEVLGTGGPSLLVLRGGSEQWARSGRTLEITDTKEQSLPDSAVERPYEMPESPPEVMRSYLEWELELLPKLRRDGTHGFFVIE